MPKPPVDFQTLRLIAEAASGRRYEDICWVVSQDPSGQVMITPQPGPCPGPEPADTVGIESNKVSYNPPPQVDFAQIGRNEDIVDLLRIVVDGKEYQADSVFWSVSAVEKFMSPYYASVYGDAGGQMVEALLNVLQPDTGDPNQAFAIAHLPNSEYTAIPEVVPEAVSLHAAGVARRVPLNPHES